MRGSSLRRYARTLIVIVVLFAVSAAILAVNPISVGGFQRGGDTLLGLSLGLDLQGGSHLEYEAALIDPDTGEKVPPTADQMDALLRTIQRRVNTSGLGEPIIQQIGEDRILVQLPGVEDLERAKGIIGETARLEFRHRVLDVERGIDGVSDGGAVDIRLELEPLPTAAPIATTTPESAATTTAESTATSTPDALPEDEEVLVPVLVIELTEEASGVFEDVIDQMRVSMVPPPGSDVTYLNYLKVAVQGSTSTMAVTYAPVAMLPTGQVVQIDQEPYIERVGTSPVYKIAVWKAGLTAEDAQARFPEGSQIDVVEVLGKVDEEIGLTGEDLARAYPGQRYGTGLPIVNIEFDSEGIRKFGELTTEIAGTPDLLAILLDDQELIAPTVREPILGGTAFIEGQDFTFERVRDISLLLESGRLPIPITLIKEESVDAILGADSLSKSVVAGLVGLALVLLFMVLYYRAAGAVAATALIIYAVLLLAIFKGLPVTLRLAGISAAILSIGMAVDANILIFERMKEELRAGRTLLAAVNIGFNRAWPAIRDSNVSTLITCAILFWFADTLGAPVVQSFAITLSIGVAASLFSAITVSRTLLRLVAATRLARRLSIFVPGGRADLPKQTSEAGAS